MVVPGDIEKTFSQNVPKGQIIAQSLTPGTKARINNAISLVIRKEPEMMEMPDVQYMVKDEAVRQLKEHFTVKTTEDYSSSVESRKVISQSVDAGTKGEEESSITLGVSIGSESIQTRTSSVTEGGGGSKADSAVKRRCGR